MRDWDSNKKGDIAEAAIRLEARRLDIEVYAPVNDHSRADMVFGLGSNLLRIQCKWARLTKDRSGLIVHMSGFRLTYAGHHRTPYSEDEIDFIAVYAGELDRCFLLPPSIFADRHEVRLRLTPARNNQQACITLADDYDFNGAVVQLARTRHWQCRGQGFESPQLHSSSSPEGLPARTIGCEELRETLGQVIDQVAAGEEIVVTRRGRPRLKLVPA